MTQENALRSRSAAWRTRAAATSPSRSRMRRSDSVSFQLASVFRASACQRS
ncbi:MAG TPA: hypothetical protein VML95_12005 [Longimicrobiales bacterium]|nr:hypothetical protein [Longimicrobiales bacterium]